MVLAGYMRYIALAEVVRVGSDVWGRTYADALHVDGFVLVENEAADCEFPVGEADR